MAEVTGRGSRVGGFLGGAVVFLLGAALTVGGAQLVALHGSPYYLLAGLVLVVTGVLLVLLRPLAGWVYALTLIATLAWAVWEAGFLFWPLLPRLAGPAVIGLLGVVDAVRHAGRQRAAAAHAGDARGRRAVRGRPAGEPCRARGARGRRSRAARRPHRFPLRGPAGDWRYYGREPGGTRYADFTQINAANVDKLKLAWTIHTGERPNKGSEDQNTPVQIGDTLYLCTPTNVVIAVDADTGREKWRHDPKATPRFWNRCRGVGYYETAAAQAAAPGAELAPCERRIISSTIDARLFALDAKTGARCAGFGQDGVVDLKPMMGAIKPGFYFPTSTPTIAGDRIILGGWVVDNQEVGEPSGVVRGFDAMTGALAWAWDVGVPAGELPAPGRTFTRGTPNVWSTPAYDPASGLVFLPTGNATPDYWASHRSVASERYNSSVVALEAATGRERWRAQTVHHDVWDFDVPSQPMLIDFPMPGGRKVPAVVALTKRGQMFVFDRATGAPLTKVVERPVPQGPQPGEWLSPTQPYSVEMPTLGAPRLTEAMMWGISPLDQLACRISYRKLRYDGDFTPPGSPEHPSLQFPGQGGGQNWGSGAFDAPNGVLITAGMRVPQSVLLNRIANAGPMPPASERPPQSAGAIPYKSRNRPLLSPLFAPCMEPPHGTLAAVDLVTRRVLWEVPMGGASSEGPFGLKSGLDIPIGTVGLGGPVATAGGLVFHASTTDPYLRAYDVRTGRVLWRARLPIGVGGTPMTYVSPKTGRQYVAVSAGGARLVSGPKGDYVLAFTLP